MEILILGEPYQYSANPHYRGTERHPPGYHPELATDAEVNKLFDRYAEEAGELGVLADVNFALLIRDAYCRLAGTRQLDVLEAVSPHQYPTVGERFLGYDLSYGLHNSLLAGLCPVDTYVKENSIEPDVTVRDVTIRIMELWHRFFEPKLNDNRLFADLDVARDCLACATAIQRLVPGAFEFGEYRPVGLWEVLP